MPRSPAGICSERGREALLGRPLCVDGTASGTCWDGAERSSRHSRSGRAKSGSTAWCNIADTAPTTRWPVAAHNGSRESAMQLPRCCPQGRRTRCRATAPGSTAIASAHRTATHWQLAAALPVRARFGAGPGCLSRFLRSAAMCRSSSLTTAGCFRQPSLCRTCHPMLASPWGKRAPHRGRWLWSQAGLPGCLQTRGKGAVAVAGEDRALEGRCTAAGGLGTPSSAHAAAWRTRWPARASARTRRWPAHSSARRQRRIARRGCKARGVAAAFWTRSAPPSGPRRRGEKAVVAAAPVAQAMMMQPFHRSDRAGSTVSALAAPARHTAPHFGRKHHHDVVLVQCAAKTWRVQAAPTATRAPASQQRAARGRPRRASRPMTCRAALQ